MVWIAPLPSTDSTMPMCSFHTIRSPAWGCAPRGSALPLCCAQEYSASTEPKPWPFGPTGTPDWRASQETKYAHHGPGPGAPAVALRYWAMRGELFEPGGCSAWPTSPCAMATMRAAAELPVGAAAGATVVAAPTVPVGAAGALVAGVATEAVRSICAKSSLDGAAVVVVVVVAGAAVVVAGAAVGPTRRLFSWVMRERAVSRLICS